MSDFPYHYHIAYEILRDWPKFNTRGHLITALDTKINANTAKAAVQHFKERAQETHDIGEHDTFIITSISLLDVTD